MIENPDYVSFLHKTESIYESKFELVGIFTFNCQDRNYGMVKNFISNLLLNSLMQRFVFRQTGYVADIGSFSFNFLRGTKKRQPSFCFRNDARQKLRVSPVTTQYPQNMTSHLNQNN